MEASHVNETWSASRKHARAHKSTHTHKEAQAHNDAQQQNEQHSTRAHRRTCAQGDRKRVAIRVKVHSAGPVGRRVQTNGAGARPGSRQARTLLRALHVAYTLCYVCNATAEHTHHNHHTGTAYINSTTTLAEPPPPTQDKTEVDRTA